MMMNDDNMVALLRALYYLFALPQAACRSGHLPVVTAWFRATRGIASRRASVLREDVNDVIHFLQLLLTNIAPPLERLEELHKKYGLSKTREAEDMCNYSEFLRQEGKEKEKLEILEQLELLHFSDKTIMTILKVNAEYLKCLRGKLQEQRAVAMADD